MAGALGRARAGRRLLGAVLVGATLFAGDLAAQDPAANLTGAWAFSVVTDNGTGTPDVTLLQEDEVLTGTYTSPRMGLRRLEGTVRGDSIQFRLETDPEAGVVMTFIGSVQADGSLTGIVDFGGMGGRDLYGAAAAGAGRGQVAARLTGQSRVRCGPGRLFSALGNTVRPRPQPVRPPRSSGALPV